MNKINSLIIDTREPESARKQCIEHFKELTCVELALPASDYLMTMEDGATVLVERKTVSDLLASIKDGRLFSQASRMKAISPWSYLVVVGSLSEKDGTVSFWNKNRWDKTNWNYNSVQGALMTAQELGVTVCHTTNFLPCIERIANRSRSEVRIKPVRDVVIFGGGEVVLSSLPGIGSTKALELIGHFKNAAWSLAFLTNIGWSDESIKGIGPKTKHSIRQALGLKDNEQLIVDSGENNE